MVPLSVTLLTPDRDFKIAIFLTLNISETIRDIAIFTIERQQSICALSNDDIFNDLDGP